MAEWIAPQSGTSTSRTTDKAAPTARPGLELLIGSNIFRNTNGVVKIQGKEQLFLESKPEQGVLLVTLDLYSEAGLHIGHLRRNVLVLNADDQLRVSIHRPDAGEASDPPSVSIIEQHSGMPIFEARLLAERKIHLATAKFYSHKGTLVDITPHYCRIGTGTTLFGDISENKGGPVVLG